MIGRLILFCALLFVGARLTYAGYYQVTHTYMPGGSTVYFVPGLAPFDWEREPDIEQVNCNEYLPSAHAGILLAWDVKIEVDWVGGGTPPSTTYLQISSGARANYDGDGVDQIVEMSNGLGDEVEHTSYPGPQEVWMVSGTRYVKLTGGQTHYEKTISVSSLFKVRPVVGGLAPMITSYMWVSGTISDRSVGLVSDKDATYSRGGSNVTVLNVPDAGGNMYGDTVFGINAPLLGTPSQADDYSYPYSFRISRSLGGGWPSSIFDLLNEWWMYDRSTVYISDGGASENTYVDYDDSYGAGSGRSIAPYLAGPVTIKTKYRATDEPASISGESLYFMRLHVPLEKVSVIDSDSGLLDRCKFPEVRAKHPKILLASVVNSTGSTMSNVSVSVTYSGSTTFGVTNGLNFSAEVPLEALKIQFGFDLTVETSDTWSLQSTISGQVSLDNGKTLEVYAVPTGTAEKTLSSVWKAHGYDKDIEPIHTEKNGTAFTLEFVVRPT